MVKTRFGLYLRNAKTYDIMLEWAQLAEEKGFYGGFLNDHVHGFANKGREPYLEAWTVMTGIGVQTQTLRIGHIVLFNSLRNPALLAKMITTLDHMTNGRVEVLIGAGWNESEYIGYDLMERGRGIPSADERIRRLIEAIRILRLMFTHEVTDFEGTFWKLKEAINMPQPIQKPIKLVIGGEKPRMIRTAVKYADGLNIPAFDGPNKVKEKIPIISEAFDRFGKKETSFEISVFAGLPILETKEDVRKYAERLAQRQQKPVQTILDNSFLGTPEEVVQKVGIIKDLGVEMIVAGTSLPMREVGIKETLERFRDEIISKV